MKGLLVLTLAVLGASAAPCGLNVVSGIVGSQGYDAFASQGCASALPGRNIFAQTAVVENPTSVFPSIIPPTSVSKSCHCLKTIVRPQIRNEIITVPTVDRVVRVVPSPIVEVVSVNCGGNTRNIQVPACGVNSGVVFEGVSGLNSGVLEEVSGVVGTGYPTFITGKSVQGFGGLINSGCGSNIIV